MSAKLQIKVVQYHWGEQNRSYPINRLINEAYCRRHGYEHVTKTFPPREDRACSWSKISAMREELHDCDFLLYLDADAFFYSHELVIEEDLIPLLGDKQIMMSVDCASESARQQSDKPNTGVILIRNSEKSAKILRDWDESSERPEMKEFRFSLNCEQEACFQTVWRENAEDVKLLKDYYLMNGFCGLFIRHLTGMADDHRLKVLREFLDLRRGTIPVSNSLKIVSFQPPKKDWKWGIGMLTTTHRPGGMLARTLESYRGTGFVPPVVFADMHRNGGLWNLHRALKTLLELYPDADAYMVSEDDVLFSKNIREYLEAELWPSVGEHGCICSIFTPTIYSSDKTWHVENRGSGTWMSQCRIYHPLSARKFIADLEDDARLQDKQRHIDAAVGGWAKTNRVNIWFHCPSLTQHISPKNTSYEADRFLDYRVGYARDFIGENRSIREYWAEFGTEPRKVRFLPRLEIFARGDSLEKDTRFQFTPEMAQNLAKKLDQYNCDVGEISFVGKGLLAWQHAEKCVQLLRLTGKIKRTKMTISVTENVDLRPSELLFDAIDIDNSGSNTNLIEKLVAKKPFYTILNEERKMVERPRIPYLFGDRIFLCPDIAHQKIDCPCSKTSPEESCTHFWTLDGFFQNLDEVLSEFGKPRACKSCCVFS